MEPFFTDLETGLQITLPLVFRRFMADHRSEIAAAAKTLRYDVVFMTESSDVIKLNREIRHYGIAPDDILAPWPREYLALSDNGAGDYQCIKLDDNAGAIYLFNGEEGTFRREFKCLDKYLADLSKRVKAFQKSGPGQSDPALLDRLSLFANLGAFAANVRGIQSPATPEKLETAGIDTRMMKVALTAMLEAVTGVARSQWRIRIGKGDSPPSVKFAYATDAQSPWNIEFSAMQLMAGELAVVLKVPNANVKADSLPVDWVAFENALGDLHTTVIRRPLKLILGKRKGSVSEYAWADFKWKCQLIGA